MTAPSLQEKLELEFARRLKEVTASPEELRKFDRNGDGQLDDEEWAVLRATLEAEVVRDLSDEPSTAPPQELPESVRLDGRYQIVEEIGRGSQGRTHLARDENGNFVALKELAFAELDSWKSFELFEREAKVLEQLNHPSIPSFVDSFHVEQDGGPSRFFIVQQFVAGEGLDVLIARGTRFSERDLINFAKKMLEVLEYLHTLAPPVIHRDIKPSNIIRHKGGFCLVDFGGVQIVSPDKVGGSTVVGTTGYMPPEQLTGRASPQSDLYALGATLIHMATHIAPSSLPQERMKLDWRSRANLSQHFASFIDKLVEPVVEDRWTSAAAAKQSLERKGGDLVVRAREPGEIVVHRPPGANARLKWDGNTLVVDMSQSMMAPMLICATLGVVVGLILMFTNGGWFWIPGGVVAGVLVAELMAGQRPTEELRVEPGGRFQLVREDRKKHRETSGRIDRLAMDGGSLKLVTDAGSALSVGPHLTPQTRRWIFSKVDEYLRDNPG